MGLRPFQGGVGGGIFVILEYAHAGSSEAPPPRRPGSLTSTGDYQEQTFDVRRPLSSRTPGRMWTSKRKTGFSGFWALPQPTTRGRRGHFLPETSASFRFRFDFFDLNPPHL